MLLTLDRWKFGPNRTGDIMDLENLKALVMESTKLGPILLVIFYSFKPRSQQNVWFSRPYENAMPKFTILR